jgi:hypothetical protein
METDSPLETQLVHKLTMLPDDRLREVLDFVEFLLSKEQQAQAVISPETLDPAQDPILQYSGGVAHGSLARDIDDDLYGE